MEPWGIYPEAAASAFRGVPNMVFQGADDGAGHPGHNKCESRVEGDRIITESKSGLWKWSWKFGDNHALLDVIETDPDRFYWFLYEGTPGGRYAPASSYFGTDRGGPEPGGHDFYKGDVLWGDFQWFYAGARGARGVLYFAQVEKDEHRDMISFLGNSDQGIESEDGMTVFGFGRGKQTNPLLSGPQKFVLGFYPGHITNEESHKLFTDYMNETHLK
jgi:hypothetical protein